MEDGHIDVPNLSSNEKNSLFGVFDGHGGNFKITKDPKLQFLLREILLLNSKPIKVIKTKNMKKP